MGLEMEFVERKPRRYALRGWSDRLLLATALLLLSVAAGTAGPVPSPPQMAIVGFDFIDTSGEVRDQSAEHDARLRTLMTRLRADLAASGKFRVADILCGPQPCTGAESDQALEQARKAGVRLVLFGAVHKMSTLILSVPIRVIDPQSGDVVFQRYHSFRGDTDEAWQRAETFLARELVAELPGK
jgi:hypothetical protein